MSRRIAAARPLLVFAVLMVAAVAVIAPTAGAASASGAAPWTFMVYLDGDNNLDPWGAYTLDLIAQGLAASGRGNVNVPVLFDHRGDGGAELGVVTAAGFSRLAAVPEPDMSSGETLAGFITWAMDACPAERYVLDVWDHGSGWVYLCSDDATEAAGTSPTGGVMLIDDLARGMAAGEAAAGRAIDLTVFEACNMGMEEVAYELRDLTGYVVGTELTQDFEGIPWQLTMAELDRDPAMTTAALGERMVDGLMLNYLTDNRHAKAIATLSVVDTAGQGELAAATDALAVALRRDMKHWQGAVQSAASFAKDQRWCSSVNGINWFADLGAFAHEVARQVRDPRVRAAAARVEAALAASVFTRHTANLDGKLYGVTVSFPPNRSAYDMKNWIGWDYAGLGLDWTADTRWDEMLRAFYVASGRV